MVVECIVCNTKINRTPSKIKRNKGKNYCSKECMRKDTVKEECKCGWCGIVFLEYPSRIKDNRGKYCSKKCSNKAKEDPNRTEKERLRDSSAMKEWKLSILHRDNFTCKKCNTKKELQVHHILGFSKYPELALNKENGIVLCKECHVVFHSTYGQYNFNEEDLICFLNN